MREMRILSPTAILGYGFPLSSFKNGMELEPHLIAVDAGSTDPGPYYLGAGVSFTHRNAVKRDLTLLLEGAISQKIPLIIGTAGGCGGAPHLQWNLEIIREIAAEKGLSFKLALIPAEIDKNLVRDALRQGQISPLKGVPELTEDDISQATRIVGQMGIEPITVAIEGGAQVILAGRAYDPAVFAAFPIMGGYDRGLAFHMGKILECASIAAIPGSGSDCAIGYLRDDHFIIEPLNPNRQCTVTSVSAHTLYEKSNPYILPGPGGHLDLRETRFTQIGEGSVKIEGSRFQPSEEYTIKLEGAKKVGYRTISVSGVRDPIMIPQLDFILNEVQDRVRDNFSELGEGSYLNFRLYGKNGVMGPLEPEKYITPYEVGIIIDVVARTQDMANTICSFARSTLLHFGYAGRLATAGNLAFPFSPSDINMGEVYNFCIYHLMKVEDGKTLFPVEFIEIGG
jgi:hypothetical protein